jgi:hypothetical protein
MSSLELPSVLTTVGVSAGRRSATRASASLHDERRVRQQPGCMANAGLRTQLTGVQPCGQHGQESWRESVVLPGTLLSAELQTVIGLWVDGDCVPVLSGQQPGENHPRSDRRA